MRAALSKVRGPLGGLLCSQDKISSFGAYGHRRSLITFFAARLGPVHQNPIQVLTWCGRPRSQAIPKLWVLPLPLSSTRWRGVLNPGA